MAILTAFPLLTDDEMSPLISEAIQMVTGGEDVFSEDEDDENGACVVMLKQDEQVMVSLVRGSAGTPPVAEAYIHRRLGLIRTTPSSD